MVANYSAIDEALNHGEHKIGALLFLWMQAGGTIDGLNSVLHGAGGHTGILREQSRARLNSAVSGVPSSASQRQREAGQRALRAARSIAGGSDGGESAGARRRGGSIEDDVRAAYAELRGR